MKIVLIDCPYPDDFIKLGYEILHISLSDIETQILPVLEQHQFNPDLFIQYESLGVRCLIRDVHKVPCPSIFISIDTHLNLYWQQYYGQLFDAVMTPHKSLLEQNNEHLNLRNISLFPHVGSNRFFHSFSFRKHELSFCGRIDANRPSRKFMVDFLKSEADIYYPDCFLEYNAMLSLFDSSCMIANEGICNELNFRIFEGASAGCLVFSYSDNEDQSACFTPKKEFEEYSSCFELIDKINFYKKNIDLAEKIGISAMKRVNAEHLPEHRVKQLVSIGKKLVRSRSALEPEALYYLSLLLLIHNGHLSSLNSVNIVEKLLLHSKTVLGRVYALKFLSEAIYPWSNLYDSSLAQSVLIDKCEELFLNLKICTPEPEYVLCFYLFLSWFLAYKDDMNGANGFLQEYIALSQNSKKFKYCDSIYELAFAWSGVLEKNRLITQTGAVVIKEYGFIPETAFACLNLAFSKDENHDRDGFIEWHSMVVRLLEDKKGYNFILDNHLENLISLGETPFELLMKYAKNKLNIFQPQSALKAYHAAFLSSIDSGQGNVFFNSFEHDEKSSHIVRHILKRYANSFN